MRCIILLLLIAITTTVKSQDIYSKYPCDSSLVYDILISGAKFSEAPENERYELQKIIYGIENYKQINGKYFIQLVVKCDGRTTDIKNDFKENSIENDIVIKYLLNIAKSNNWYPAVHREKRVPNRTMISIVIKKGRIKKLKLGT